MTNLRILKILLTICILLPFKAISAQDTVRILALGNSFAGNALESYLSDLTQSAGIPTIIANAYIGGCTLERHWKNAEDSSAPYEYRKIMPDGKKSVEKNKTILYCIEDEPWDYISFLQASGFSGLPESYFPYLSNLIEYVKIKATNPKVELIFLQTWAYDTDSQHPHFPNYGNSQSAMYRAIVNSVKSATEKSGIKTVVPAGTAIQNVRANFPGIEICRDGYHLNDRVGEFTASCVWFETLFGKVRKNRFVPDNVGPYQAKIAKKAAYYAVRNPNETTIFVKPKCTVGNGTLRELQ